MSNPLRAVQAPTPDELMRADARCGMAFRRLESEVIDVQGAAKAFLALFRSVFDNKPDRQHDGVSTFEICEDRVTGMIFAAAMLDRMTDQLHAAYTPVGTRRGTASDRAAPNTGTRRPQAMRGDNRAAYRLP